MGPVPRNLSEVQARTIDDGSKVYPLWPDSRAKYSSAVGGNRIWLLKRTLLSAKASRLLPVAKAVVGGNKVCVLAIATTAPVVVADKVK